MIQEAYVHGISTRAVYDLVKAMGGGGMSKSQVSRLCADIDIRVNAFLNRQLEGTWPYLWLDATYIKVRDGGRIVSRAVIVAVAGAGHPRSLRSDRSYPGVRICGCFRPDGIAKHDGQSTQLPLPASNFGNPTAVAEAIKANLLGDDSIDGVMTQGNQDADSAATGIMQAGVGDRVSLGTFNLDEASLNRIKKGTQMFVVDQ